MKRILIRDTVGVQIHNNNEMAFAAQNAMPHVKFFGHTDPDADVDQDKAHPHGFMAAWYAAILFFPDPVEVHFQQIFDQDGNGLGVNSDWLWSNTKDIHPTDDNNSWGNADMDVDNPSADSFYGAWAVRYMTFQNELGFRSNFAAGNDDENDPDNDIDRPQRFLNFSAVVGSCDVDGVPSGFSGDGPELTNIGWGERIWLNEFGEWVSGSGTSFSCPKTCGLRSFLGLDYDAFISLLSGNSAGITRPEGSFPGDRNRKWGYANVEDLWQRLFRERVPIDMRFPTKNPKDESLKWMNMKMVA